MATTEITEANLHETLNKDGIVLLDWWATWCAPCRAFAPVFESVSEKYPDITFGKIDTDAQQRLASAFEIRSIPTLMIFRDGVPLFSRPGALPAAALEELINQARELDMEEVRRKLAQAEPPKA